MGGKSGSLKVKTQQEQAANIHALLLVEFTSEKLRKRERIRVCVKAEEADYYNYND